jgi:cell division protein FtsB
VRQRAGILAAALALAGVMALAVFPTQAYLAQRRHHDELTDQVADLGAKNQDLRNRATQLQTDEEIERLARLQYHLVRPGEEAYVILPDDTPPTSAPPAPAATPEPDGNWFSRAWSRVTSLF